jgi:hypothetical protein
MPMNTPHQPPRIRACMPEGYLPLLAERTGVKVLTNLSQIVRLEQTSSKHWPEVERLAAETNPEGFAAWQAAQHTAVPAAA